MVSKCSNSELHGFGLRVTATVLVVSIGLAIPVVAYDAAAACDYARRYYSKVCSDGYFYRESYPPSYLGAGTPVPTDTYGPTTARTSSPAVSVQNRTTQVGGCLYQRES